ncbi:QsdR family transcriptional regulator [Gordonia sp. (in: high G+C Gram-positive bacteria)]|uniref:QsdR family transcriptional regulator n=1 Tax=Gordonia sp. (in: high G+C Gram-positive bacteria) TaxID=84139 RepID=UPI003342CC7F
MTSNDVVALATRAFIAGERIEVGELATEAGVNRSTVYRRFHGRDGLLGEVIWGLTSRTMEAAIRRSRGEGAARITSLMVEFATLANTADHIRLFFSREPERALRVMTTQAGGVQPRIVERITEVIDDEVAAGHLTPPLPTPDLALILVRITETFVYANVITGEEPDAVKVGQACGALLGLGAHERPIAAMITGT